LGVLGYFCACRGVMTFSVLCWVPCFFGGFFFPPCRREVFCFWYDSDAMNIDCGVTPFSRSLLFYCLGVWHTFVAGQSAHPFFPYLLVVGGVGWGGERLKGCEGGGDRLGACRRGPRRADLRGWCLLVVLVLVFVLLNF